MPKQVKRTPGMNQAHEHSVTRFIRDLNAGRNVSVAQAEIFKRYFRQLDALATLRLGKYQRVVDGEDVAVRTMHILFEKAEQGDLREVDSRDHLLALLRRIAKFDALNQVASERTAKRGGGAVATESAFGDRDSERDGIENAAVAPEDALESRLTEACEAIAKIDDERLRTVASLTLQGLAARDIADELGVSRRTVERLVRRTHELLADS